MHLVNLVDCFYANRPIFIAFETIVVIKTLFVIISPIQYLHRYPQSLKTIILDEQVSVLQYCL